MTKRFTKVIVCAVAMLIAHVCAFAQTPKQPPQQRLRVVERLKTNQHADKEAVQRQFPALMIPRQLESAASSRIKSRPIVLRESRRTTGSMADMLTAAGAREIWGNLAGMGGWTSGTEKYGVYSFKAQAPLSLNPVATDGGMNANAGSALVDGVYHVITADYTLARLGIVDLFHSKYDANTWDMIGTTEEVKYQNQLIAIEQAYDRKNGKVYGLFYNSSLSAREFGIIDYTTLTRTTIGVAQNYYVALGITSEGVMYGIAEDGNLYSISTETGEETLVGATGIELKDEKGTVYQQTGEIDQNTNTFYWTAVSNTGITALYTVDLTTGQATKVSDFTNYETWQGLMFPAIDYEADAPSAVTDMTVTMVEDTQNGTLKFNLPTTSNAGDPLTENVTYAAYVGETSIGEGEGEPGQEISIALNNLPYDLNIIKVSVKNSVGDGPVTLKRQWVGFDVPKAPRWPRQSLDIATGKNTISWYAPDGMEHDGYQGELTYKVVRMPDGKVLDGEISSKYGKANITDDLSGMPENNWYYIVYAKNGDKISEGANSDKKVYGEGHMPPYRETFDTKESIDNFTMIDGNGSFYKWVYGDDEQAIYFYGKWRAPNAWAITPKLALKSGRTYTFRMKTMVADKAKPERIEVKMGNDRTVEAMTTEVIGQTEVASQQYVTYEGKISPEADGDYFIGIHTFNEKPTYVIYVDDIELDIDPLATAPKGVTELKSTPDADGAPKTVISFTAPTEAIDGTALTSISKIEVKRDGQLVKTFDNPAPGAQLQFEDETEKDGLYKYVVTAYAGDEFGEKATIDAYLGFDVPLPPKVRTLEDLETQVKFSWSQVPTVGVRGGVVKPEDCTFIVYDTEEDNTATERARVDGNEYVFDLNTDEGEQRMLVMGLAAENKAGRGGIYGSDGLTIGAPYTLPFKDTFGDISDYYWWVDRVEDSSFSTDEESETPDGDNRSILLTVRNKKSEAWLNSGKLSLKGSTQPMVFFDCNVSAGAKLLVELQSPTKTVTLGTIEPSDGWKAVSYELPEEMIDERYVFVKFHAQNTSDEEATVAIDNMTVRDMPTYNLTLSMAAPKSVTRGGTANIKVKVANDGIEPMSDYTVVVKAGEQTLLEEEVSDELEAFAEKTFDVELPTSIFSADESVTITANVANDYDEVEGDNAAEANIMIEALDLPQPGTAKADVWMDNAKVSWTAPASTNYVVNEDFEKYPASIIDGIGPWTLYDGDEGYTGDFGVEDAPEHDNQGSQMAFQVVNLEAWGFGIEENPSFVAHSGKQYLGSFYAFAYDWSTGKGYYVDQDNWLVSPELPGHEQTISFWVRNSKLGEDEVKESFDVLASTTGNATEDFTATLIETTEVTGGEWQQFTATLPEGTKYFAIHHNTPGGSYFFMLDDVSYEMSAGEILGYRIYAADKSTEAKAARAGGKQTEWQLVAEAEADAQTVSFNLDNAGFKQYAVTVVYTTGESAPLYATVTTGVNTVENAANTTFDVYAIDGKLVGRNLKSLDKLPRGVYIVNGKKYIVK